MALLKPDEYARQMLDLARDSASNLSPPLRARFWRYFMGPWRG